MSAIVVDLQDHRSRILSRAPAAPTNKPSSAGFHFTSGQRQAYYGILDAIHRKNYPGALLQGYAGCGKTVLAAQIIRRLQEDGYRVAVTAPTHKAVQVLTRTLATELQMPETMTVHALLGLRLVRFLNGSQSFQPSSHNKIHNFNVIIVDECSMIDSRFFHLLQEGNAFLLFLGDPAQLPPVGSHQPSPVFESRHLLRFMLDEVIRQSNGSPILGLAQDIRRQNDSQFPVQELHRYADGESLQVFTRSTFHHAWKDSNTRILAWRNQSVNQYNSILHDALFPTDRMPYSAGERIVLQESTHAKINDQILLLANGGEGTLKSIQDIAHPDWPHIPTWKMNVIMDSVIAYDDREDGDPESDHSDQHRHVLQQVGITLWIPKDARSVHAQADDYFRMYRLESTRKNETKAREYSMLGWKLRDDFTDVKQAYSSTVHKSQGSTYDTAIVDIADLAHPKASPVFNRLLYTAVTRPRRKLILVV